MAFSPADTAFEGFRVARRKPLAVLIWALLFAAYVALWVFVAGGAIVALIAAAAELEGVTEPTPEQLTPMLAAMSGLWLTWPISMIFSAVIYSAINRAVLRPEDSAFGYVRLGGDEFRVLIVTIVLSILGMVGAWVLMFVASLITLMLAGALGDASGFVIFAFMLLCAALVIWVVLRLSLAIPITFAERRIAIFDSWSVTKGHVLRLLGMAVIVVIMCMVVQFLVVLVAMPLAFATGGFGQLAQLQDMEPEQIVQTMLPVILVFGGLVAVVSALIAGILYAPFAAAYRAITASRSQG